MAKVFTLLRRKEGWSWSEFSDYWATTHKDHALDLARAGFFSGYVQNHLITGLPGSTWPAADGIPEIWVPSIDSLADLAASEVYQQGAGRDEANFTSGAVDSYISAGSPEAGLTELSLPTPRIRHLLLLQTNSQKQIDEIVGCLDRCDQGQAPDLLITASATDPDIQCVVVSGFWPNLTAAHKGASAMAALLLELSDVYPVSAGVYEARTVVNPLTGKWS
ncbi:EthD domain-containing protein [Pseudomonas profundi]|nr:EthD domain-containing protein [Pseudomonas profundi]